MPIVYTLHEYLPICHRDGQLVRTNGGELCMDASPRRCNECFPEWSPEQFFLRERLIKSTSRTSTCSSRPATSCSSATWTGASRATGSCSRTTAACPRRRRLPTEADRPRNRLGFFGQLSHYKGLDVLLKAMRDPAGHRAGRAPVAARREPRRLQPPTFARPSSPCSRRTAPNVTFTGSYDHAEVPHLMAEIDWVVVPSRWWENSPLVIQEAFMHGRPVICSDIGGMAEKVTDGVNGLHFRVGDPAEPCAETIRAASTTPGLWERLQAGIPGIFTMSDHVANLTRIYDELADRHRPPQPPVPTLAPVET